MRQLITWDTIDDLELGGPLARDPAEHHRIAASTLVDWATDADLYELEDGITPAHLLVTAAEHREMAGDLDGARSLAEAAREQPSSEPFQAHPILISIALATGARDSAVQLADEARREPSIAPHVIEMIAENFELVGELALAERFFTIGARREGAAWAEPSEQYFVFLTGRFRVRRDAGKPLDGLDEEAQQDRAERGLDPLV